MDDMGLDAEAMQRYIAAMPSVEAERDRSSDMVSPVDRSGTGLDRHTRTRKDRTGKAGTDHEADIGADVASKVSPSSPSNHATSPDPSRKDLNKDGESIKMVESPAGDKREETAVISFGCDVGGIGKGDDVDNIVVKQEATVSIEGTGSRTIVLDGGLQQDIRKQLNEGKDPIHFVEQEKEVLILTLNKKEDPDPIERQNNTSDSSQSTDTGLHRKLKFAEGGESQSVSAETPPRKRTKADGSKPSLQEVISNLSQGASLLRDLANSAGAHLSHSSPSVSSIPAIVSNEPDGMCDPKKEKVEASKSDITQSSWFSLPSNENVQKEDGRDGEEIHPRSVVKTSATLLSSSCQHKSEALLPNQKTNATTSAQLSSVGGSVPSVVCPVVISPKSQSPQPKPPPAHHKPARRRARKAANSPKDSNGDGSSLSCSGIATVPASLSSNSQQTAAIRGTAPAAVVSPLAAAQGTQSMFSVPYSPILPAVYDYSLPDRGLSSATASILAAASSSVGFPSPQPQPTPFMMSYFPLQPMWGGPGTVAIAAAAAAAAASVNVPTPLDLSSPSKESSNVKPPTGEPQEPLYLGKKDNCEGRSPGGSTQIVKDAGAQTPSSSSHAPSTRESSRAAKRSNHHKSTSVKTGGSSAGVFESGEKPSRGSPKGAGGLEKQVESVNRRKEAAANPGQKTASGKDSSSSNKSPGHQMSTHLPQDPPATSSSRARYEKNLLLFGDQEVEIMNVGKLRWVVRNEADLLRIAQANLRKWSAPACDSATVILEANSSTENSTASTDKAPDCPVSSSERREEGDQDDTSTALTVVQPVTSHSASALGLQQQPASNKPIVLPSSSLGKRGAEETKQMADHALVSPSKSLKLSNGVEGLPAAKEAGTDHSSNACRTLSPSPKTTGQLTGLPNFLIDLGAVSEASSMISGPAAGITSASASTKASPLSSTLLPMPAAGSDQLASSPTRQALGVTEPSSLASLLSSPPASATQRAIDVDTAVRSNTTRTEEVSKQIDAPTSMPTMTILSVEADNSLNKEYSLLSNMLKSAH